MSNVKIYGENVSTFLSDLVTLLLYNAKCIYRVVLCVLHRTVTGVAGGWVGGGALAVAVAMALAVETCLEFNFHTNEPPSH